MTSPRSSHVNGFSLVEIAIGLAILSFATFGLLASISKQNEQTGIRVTTQLLEQSREAVMAFVAINGRLPCPALAGGNGQEAIALVSATTITCTRESGFLPAVTLGLSGVSTNGFLNDGFEDGAGVGNATYLRAIRYGTSRLAAPYQNALTSPGLGAPTAMSRRIDIQQSINNGQGVFVCRQAAGMGAGLNRCGTAANTLASNAVAVIWSRGLNGNAVATYSADEIQNANQAIARGYVSRPFAPAGAAGGGFDDQLVWISYPLLADRLVRGGFVQ